MRLSKAVLALSSILSLSFAGQGLAADIPTDDNGNRYDRARHYDYEISSSDAYLDMMQNKRLIIDVRTRREYAAGHPERAYNVPHPNIDSGVPQNDADFYWEVYDIVKGRTDTPVVTLCRTGSRSIRAANILADPLNTAGDTDRTAVPGGIPFANAANNWDGFVGREKYAFIGGVPDPDLPLDLNNDGFINEDKADVYAHTKDYNPDKDGWRNFYNLPWTTKIRKPLAYMQDTRQYACWQTDEGC